MRNRLTLWVIVLLALAATRPSLAQQRQQTPIYDELGRPLRVAREIIVKFDPTLMQVNAVDNLSLQEGVLADFVNPTALEALASGLGQDMATTPTYRIFTQLTTADSLSTDRQGQQVPLPRLWSALTLALPAGMDEAETCHLLNQNLLGTVEFAHLNWLPQATIDAAVPITRDPLFGLAQASLVPTANFPETANPADCRHINVQRAWSYETGSSAIRVGVYDSGIDWRHPDFGNGTQLGANRTKVVNGWDWVNVRPFDVYPDGDGHGTAVAGIIGALRNNPDGSGAYEGIAGIAGGNNQGAVPNRGVSLYNMKILATIADTRSAGASADKIAEAIVNGAILTPAGRGYGLHVMNHSWVFSTSIRAGDVPLVKQAVQVAFYNKVTVVAGRGNDGTTDAVYPACFDDYLLLNVSSTGIDGLRKTNLNGAGEQYASSYGQGVDVAAPGGRALVSSTQSSYIGIGYRSFSGTSAATPHVSGVAALLLSYHRNVPTLAGALAPEDVEQIIERTALDKAVAPGYDDELGWGLLDAGNALYRTRKNVYQLAHHAFGDTPTSTQIALHAGSAAVMLPERVGSVAAGRYVADIYKVTATYPNSVPASHDLVAAWARPSSSSLWSAANPIVPYGYAEVEAASATSVRMAGYCYHIRTTVAGRTINQWLPYNPYTSRSTYQGRYAYTNWTYNAAAALFAFGRGSSATAELEPAAAYPNPATEQLTVAYTAAVAAPLMVEIQALNGQVVRRQQHQSAAGRQQVCVPLTGLSAGLYVCRLVGGARVEVLRFSKQ